MKVPALTIAVLSLFWGGIAAAETRTDLVGTWDLVSNTIEQNGKTSPNYGDHPKGVLILTRDGHYASMAMRSDLPKFASGKRLSGTPDENKAVVQGSIAHFGTYTVDGSTMVFHIENSTFPNWTGKDQKRPFSLTGNKLVFTLPASGATGTSRVEYERAPPQPQASVK